jgi:hypothetical protein
MCRVLTQYDVTNVFQVARTVLASFLSQTPKLQQLLYQGYKSERTDPMMSVLLSTVSRPLSLTRIDLSDVLVSSTNLLEVFDSVAPTPQRVMLRSITLTDVLWHSVFEYMASRLQLGYVHLESLEGVDGNTVIDPEVQRQRSFARGSECRAYNPRARELENTTEGHIGSELDDGYVWVFRGSEYDYADYDAVHVVLDGLDDVND